MDARRTYIAQCNCKTAKRNAKEFSTDPHFMVPTLSKDGETCYYCGHYVYKKMVKIIQVDDNATKAV